MRFPMVLFLLQACAVAQRPSVPRSGIPNADPGLDELTVARMGRAEALGEMRRELSAVPARDRPDITRELRSLLDKSAEGGA